MLRPQPCRRWFCFCRRSQSVNEDVKGVQLMVWVIVVWLVLSALATTWSLAACVAAGRAEQSMHTARGNHGRSLPHSVGRASLPSATGWRASWHPYTGFRQTRLAVVGQPAVCRHRRKSVSVSHRRIPR